MANIDRHRLINVETKEISGSGRFITIGGLDIGVSLHQCGDGGKRIGPVDINGAPGLKAGGVHHIRFPTGHGQVRNE